MSSAPPSTSTLCIKCHDSVSTQDTIFLRNESFCRFVVLSFLFYWFYWLLPYLLARHCCEEALNHRLHSGVAFAFPRTRYFYRSQCKPVSTPTVLAAVSGGPSSTYVVCLLQ